MLIEIRGNEIIKFQNRNPEIVHLDMSKEETFTSACVTTVATRVLSPLTVNISIPGFVFYAILRITH
jgi:hypothetical protein